MAGIGVEPYWELAVDASGALDPVRRDALARGVRERRLTDLVVFAHGWNNDHTTTTRLLRRFFTPFPALLVRDGTTARVGYAGVFWPSLRFAEEPAVDHKPNAFADQAANMALERGVAAETLDGLVALFPEHTEALRRMNALLRERPLSQARLAEFLGLVRKLSGEPPLAMLNDLPARVYEEFAGALERTGARLPGDPFARLWSGAREVLRQAAYGLMLRRGARAGEVGLGPALGRLARDAAGTRVHLLGHGFGAALAASAARSALRPAASLTLLQAPLAELELRGVERRVAGPVVACHSRHDDWLGVLYPIATRVTGTPEGPRAVGYAGLAEEAVRLPLAATAPSVTRRFPDSGRVSVDASSVVRNGCPPVGAHLDVCHADLARVVLRAARIMR
ncbi:hypothetical protein ABZ832_22735 [Streptantibioticus parmotrematis]|uniref:hypothetical protein n=1 Tax=Streptantibioticus parmotrematis TaxID=2873249 RepID=UPI0033C04C00